MTNIEADVIKWHRETFPNITAEAMQEKPIEELAEFEEECFLRGKVDMFSKAAVEEFADLYICYTAGLKRIKGKSLCKEIAKKLDIDKRREWGEETTNGDRPRVKP